VGEKVPMQLAPHAHGVLAIWPITALLGAVGVIWGVDAGQRDVSDTPVEIGQTG